EFFEATDGDRNFGRINHEAADRYVSDVALHPDRPWAFLLVNAVPVGPGGVHNTVFAGEPGCPAAGTPTQSGSDIPIARDHARLAQYLLTVLREHAPTFTLGVGYANGARHNFMLN